METKDDNVEETTVKNEEEKTSKNTQEDEANEEDTSEKDESGESNEKNPYEQKLKELEEKEEVVKKREEHIDNKEKALQAERTKRKELEQKLNDLKSSETEEKEEQKPKYLTQDDVDRLFEEKINKQNQKDMIDRVSSDDSEKKLITKLLDTGRAKTVEDAKYLANAHVIDDHLRLEQEREQQENIMAGFSAGQSRGRGKLESYEKDPILKTAADGLTPEERKYLK